MIDEIFLPYYISTRREQHLTIYRDIEVYKAWKKANPTSRGILASSMIDDLIHEWDKFPTPHAMWANLRGTYGVNL